MKKIVLMMAVMGAITTTTFAHDKGKGKKEEKCTMKGKDCCKKMRKAAAEAKAGKKA